MADDSTNVVLNGVQLMAEATRSGNHYRTCSDFPIGCLATTRATIHLNSLPAGINTLSFTAAQRAGGSFGLDFAGQVSNAALTVPRFAYVPNLRDNTVSIYTVNASTGQLRDNGYVLAGRGPGALTLGGSFLYVSNFYSNNVSAYRINASTGALTPLPGSPFKAGTGPASPQVSADGKFLFVANNGSNDVSAYRINSTTGTLSPVPGSPFAAGAGPYFVAVEPSRQYV
jgi:6-phosphogluconolactonase (cycloisomerase 2 family)